jgi:DNA-binding MarR family transcriptional regulator
MGSLRTRGITIPKFFLMKFLYYHGKRKTSEISELLGISLPAVSEILNSMENENLIIRTHDENDRRVVAIELSQEGKALVNSLEKHNQGLIEEALNAMPVENFEIAVDFLGKLTGILHNSVELKIKKSGE